MLPKHNYESYIFAIRFAPTSLSKELMARVRQFLNDFESHNPRHQTRELRKAIFTFIAQIEYISTLISPLKEPTKLDQFEREKYFLLCGAVWNFSVLMQEINVTFAKFFDKAILPFVYISKDGDLPGGVGGIFSKEKRSCFDYFQQYQKERPALFHKTDEELLKKEKLELQLVKEKLLLILTPDHPRYKETKALLDTEVSVEERKFYTIVLEETRILLQKPLKIKPHSYLALATEAEQKVPLFVKKPSKKMLATGVGLTLAGSVAGTLMTCALVRKSEKPMSPVTAVVIGGVTVGLLASGVTLFCKGKSKRVTRQMQTVARRHYSTSVKSGPT